MVGIINYGSGNVEAIANLHRKANIPYFVSDDAMQLEKAERLILPGVGAFDETMILLRNKNLFEFLNDEVLVKKKPIVGFCVGMQILGESSEEGDEKGFGWIKGKIKKFDPNTLAAKPHLPHLGWNSIEVQRQSPLLDNVNLDYGFYYLHSYYFDCANVDDILATTNYGINFSCLVNHENVYGAQFHPEKSHSNGIEFFKNFSKLNVC